MKKEKLTDQEFWDDYWDKVSLPIEIKKNKKDPHTNEILKIFDKYFPKNKNLSVLEIGGAPGQFLVYMHKNFHCKISCLDYSNKGCEKTRMNFDLLNINGEVLNYDLFSENIDLKKFDVVYSLGFIEHFSDLNEVINKHLQLLKPGGLLILGVPNFLGVNHWFLKRLSPDLLAKHNLTTMNIDHWHKFEEEFNLVKIFRDYVGGFEPWVFNRYDKKSFVNYFIYLFVKLLCFLFHSHFKFLKKFNSKYFSGYAIGVYKKINN